MSSMPGNPFYADMDQVAVNVSAETMATLALAFEQRTANLIAVAVAQDQRGMVGDRYWEEVAERLGLDGDEA